MVKKKGRKMAGLGLHHSTTEGKRVKGHSLVLGMYLVLGRRCPLAPRLYRQRRVCASEGVPIARKSDLMLDLIRTFVPLQGTRTHVLLDSWYSAKRLWKAARQRGFLITTGLKKNRALRITDPSAPRGWRWERLDTYAQQLSLADYQRVPWPSQASQAHLVYAHVVSTRVRTLYRCHVIIIRETLEAEPRFWASSDLEADVTGLIAHLATRWAIEVLFSDGKDLLGLDQYQIMRATSLLRFWVLALAAYTFLDEERTRLFALRHEHLTQGDARRALQQRHQEAVIGWICAQHDQGFAASAIAAWLGGTSPTARRVFFQEGALCA
jgi:SRSO17 transposase